MRRTRHVAAVLKAATLFTLVFVAAAVPTSRLTARPASSAPTTARAVAAVPVTNLGFHLHQGCRQICEPPDPPSPTPDPAPPADSDAQPAAAAPAPAPAPPRPAPPPPPAIVIGSTQQSLINADRRAAGLPPLSWSGCLAGIAASWAGYMARTGVFQHGPGVSQDFGCGLGSRQTGENIAWMTGGPNDYQANTMFMNSPEHRANILGPYRFVGTAWASANGKSYIVEEFG
jgi:uncharacterized protein YkwD